MANAPAAGSWPSGCTASPTEALWEFACRAGTWTKYATGETLSGTQANFDSAGLPKELQGPYLRETTPVGKYPANAWGLHDMHGNLWEWCADAFVETLPGGTDPLVDAGAPYRVFRGGCWHNPSSLCRSAVRAGMPPENRGSGMRVPTGRPGRDGTRGMEHSHQH